MPAHERPPRPIEVLAARMKGYEREAEQARAVSADLPLLVRIDGHKFSTVTRGFQKPFDARLHRAMQRTTKDLVRRFQALTGFTESDEITLVWAACAEPGQTIMFGGRVTKIASVLSGYTSVRFAHHLAREDFSAEPALAAQVADPEHHFDARVFNVPSRDEALENLVWRSVFDCPRNALSLLCRAHYSAKALNGLGRAAQLAKLAEVGVSFEAQPVEFRCGSYVKRELFAVDGEDPRTGERKRVMRSRVVSAPMDLGACLEAASREAVVEWLFAKQWGGEVGSVGSVGDVGGAGAAGAAGASGAEAEPRA